VATKRGSAGRPRRSSSSTEVRKELLVFVEGKRTEEDYLVFWQRAFRRQVSVQIGETRGAPITLVEAARVARRLDKRGQKRGEGRAYDEIWCVFDVDEHPSLDSAIQMAAQNEISVAVSNPCIELWFILHFQDQTAFLDRHSAQRRSAELLCCRKALSTPALEQLYEHYGDARVRAVDLDTKHAGDGSPAGENPSSGAWRLIESLRIANPTS
jgi:hypothetical protein